VLPEVPQAWSSLLGEQSPYTSPSLQRDSKGCNVPERQQKILYSFNFKTLAPITDARLFAAFVLP